MPDLKLCDNCKNRGTMCFTCNNNIFFENGGESREAYIKALELKLNEACSQIVKMREVVVDVCEACIYFDECCNALNGCLWSTKKVKKQLKK